MTTRHASRASIEAGCTCDGCRLMARVYANQEPPKAQRRRATRARAASTPLVDGTAWGSIIAALLAQGRTVNELSVYCGCGGHTIGDLAAGKRKVRAATVPKLRRLLELLP